ncbi:MerR family transcriptional regulator [Pseudobutyrivibrio xylanivorans]|uniref:DNA-binding transcriptional regulator, MerR family n=1 Tax=Pseudobutyrivibrio xylanivorans DSM 14809 TaxID=1123012 RepID=A0A1M6JMK8_PSEXY|nr:MerR family transcriptional regulator [Pseudobutyrivibrio xylanivorans]SHJ47965.1 DNA-binding transcriptional regulator, MerR family [Pseudobutyrivibrio xylanivorans DSM 14809]
MNKKMTSGEIAERTGVTQKALRLYDEKGLLKPVGYTEGNYRLYDNESLNVLEKIIALKHVGFSLEEIKDNLEHGEREPIADILKQQIEETENKILELQRAVKAMQAVLARTEEKANWDLAANIIRKVEKDQRADSRRLNAVAHAADGIEWYEKIFNNLGLKKNEKGLDLGCGYSALWRENWDRIPEGITIDGYDVKESWAEDFAQYIEDNKKSLPEAVDISLFWGDLEDVRTWDNITPNSYDKVIAHYLLNFLGDIKKFVSRAAETVKPGGMLSVNYFGVVKEYAFWEQILSDAGVDNRFAKEEREAMERRQAETKAMLSEFFREVQVTKIPGPLRYTTVEELIERMNRRYPNSGKYIKANRAKLEKHFAKLLEENESVVVDIDTIFYHCYK